MTNSVYSTTKWKKLRTQILKRDEHICHHCGKPATTVDHLTPLALGGDPYDPANLAAACANCNYSKGGKLGRAKQLGKQTPEPTFFGDTTAPTKRHSESLPNSDISVGSVVPRLHSALLDGPTLADDVIEWAKTHTDPLLPWQEWVLRDALAVDDAGELRRKTITILISRQNGKTHLARVVIAYFMANRPRFQVIGVAQKLPLAKETWQNVVCLFQDSPALNDQIQTIRYANGEQELRLKNGSRFQIMAASRRARGYTADLIYVDELREINSDAWESLQPFVTTTGGQIWATSNAGDITSEALNNLRANILASPSDRYALYEWSAPEKASITDRAGWAMANPALGHLFDVQVLEDSLQTMTPGAFRTERMCQFVTALNPAIPMEALEECGDPTLRIEPSLGRVCYFAIDQTNDSKRADLIVAQILDDGKIGWRLLQSWTHTGAVDDTTITTDIIQHINIWRPREIGYNQYAAGNIAQRLAGLGHIMRNVTGAAFSQACDELLSAVVHGRIVHDSGPDLVQHFAHSVAKPAGDGGWRFARRESGGYISIACAAAIATHMAVAPQSSPMIVAV